jgi:hypothetical protein
MAKGSQSSCKKPSKLIVDINNAFKRRKDALSPTSFNPKMNETVIKLERTRD